jgi:hypothetical protein
MCVRVSLSAFNLHKTKYGTPSLMSIITAINTHNFQAEVSTFLFDTQDLNWIVSSHSSSGQKVAVADFCLQ